MTFENLEIEILSLPRDSQAALLARLLAHLGCSNEIDREVASIWGEEAELRDREMDNDQMIGIPADQVFQQVRVYKQSAIKGLKGKLTWDGNLDEMRASQ